MKKNIITWLCVLLTGYVTVAQTTLFAYGSSWTYLDNGTDQGTNWRSTSFNDNSWKTGVGKFGYGVSGIGTLVGYGGNPDQKYVTTYFRKTIFLANPSGYSSFTGGVLRDDGVVVYVNGVEVYRNSMPAGSMNYLTLAGNADDNGTVTQSFTINKSAFVSGNNMIAVEIHQKNATTSDMVFDMQLTGNGAALDVTPPSVASIVRQSPAAQLTNASQVVFRTTFTEKVTGVDFTDFLATTVSGNSHGSLLNGAVAMVDAGSTYDITVSSVQGDGVLRLDLKAGGTGITDTAGNTTSAGYTNGETYFVQQQPPVVLSVNRRLPVSANTDSTAVSFRVTFSEKVRGVDAADFLLVTSGGNVRGTLTKLALSAASTSLIEAVSVAGPDSTAYDVSVRAIAGSGVIRLDVKDSNTGITDISGSALVTGFTSGQTYTVNVVATQGFRTFVDIDPLSIATATRELPQAKVWSYSGKWWAVLGTPAGTKLFRLDGTTWTDVLTLNTATNSRADCRVMGNLVHLLLFRGTSTSYFISLEYDPALNAYKRWTQRTSTVNLVFEQGVASATLDIDTRGRIWIASNSLGNMLVRWSDAPYSTWSAPITIASGAVSEDICVVTAFAGKIGVLWSDQNVRRFGFKTHVDGADPAVWSQNEVPASQSAQNVGSGMADNHLNMVAASDGTVYCAIKTGYDKNGLPAIGLLVRRPGGSWDNLYPVASSKEGNRPIVILNEAIGKIKVVYNIPLINFDGTRSGDILYRESSTSTISFGAPVTLLSGNGSNSIVYAGATHQTYNPAVLILSTNESVNPLKAVSILATDAAQGGSLTQSKPSLASAEKSLPVIAKPADQAGTLLARPNPFSTSTRIDFRLSQTGQYSITLYDNMGSKVMLIKQGWGEAGSQYSVNIDSYQLADGFYTIKFQSAGQIQTLKLLKSNR